MLILSAGSKQTLPGCAFEAVFGMFLNCSRGVSQLPRSSDLFITPRLPVPHCSFLIFTTTAVNMHTHGIHPSVMILDKYCITISVWCATAVLVYDEYE